LKSAAQQTAVCRVAGPSHFSKTSSGQAYGRTALFRLAPTAAKRDIQQQVLVPTQMRDHLVAM